MRAARRAAGAVATGELSRKSEMSMGSWALGVEHRTRAIEVPTAGQSQLRRRRGDVTQRQRHTAV